MAGLYYWHKPKRCQVRHALLRAVVVAGRGAMTACGRAVVIAEFTGRPETSPFCKTCEFHVSLAEGS